MSHLSVRHFFLLNPLGFLKTLGVVMKQGELVKQMYQACLNRDVEGQRKLFEREISKIIKRRETGKRFNSKWTVAD